MFKKLLSSFALSALALGAHAQETLSVGASPVPHAEILKFVAPALKQEGVDLKIVEFTDFVLPNIATDEKQIDANFFQHKPYLDSFNADRKTNLVPVANGAVHIEPFGAYSKKVKAIADLKEGAVVAIPNDPSNTGRSLMLLQSVGLIELKDPSNILATERDIVKNDKKLKFHALESAQIPRALEDVDLALINTNYALEAGLMPTKDALVLEGPGSVYANIIVTRADEVNDPRIAKLVKVLRTPEVKEFIENKYKGAITPAF